MLLDMTSTVLNKLRYYPDIHQRDVRKPEKHFSCRNLKPNPPNTKHVCFTLSREMTTGFMSETHMGLFLS